MMRRMRVALAIGLTAAGCTPGHLVTHALEEPLDPPVAISVGPFLDRLPLDTLAEDRPDARTIGALKSAIGVAIEAREDLTLVGPGDDPGDYELRGAILEYREGNVVARFFLGLGAARTVAELHLVDRTDGSVAFSGNFVGEVTGWREPTRAMFSHIATEFCRALDEQHEILARRRRRQRNSPRRAGSAWTIPIRRRGGGSRAGSARPSGCRSGG